MPRYPRSRTRSRLLGAIVSVLTVLLASTVLTVSFVRGNNGRVASRQLGVTQSPSPNTPTQTSEPADAAGQPGIVHGQLEADLARLRATPEVTTDSPLPRIAGDATTQPDLYAAAFTEGLMTQDYREPRQALLSWVQGESARTDEPIVVGLVPPELRDRWAVFSVTDATDGPAPIPTAGQWAKLSQQAAKTTVRVQRVTEPMAWTNALEAGRITDPGITARIVSAEVTLTTVVDGHTRHQVSSVELGLELEGPPTRNRWGFLAAVTYTAIPMGSS
jgi:hypothetical protein